MKIKNLFLGTLAVAMLLTACAVTDIDRDVNFNTYRTFKWSEANIAVTNPLYESDLIGKNIKKLIEEEFAKRGILVSSTNPDFLINYSIRTETKQKTVGGGAPYYPYGFYPFGMWGWGWRSPMMWGYPYAYGPGSYTREYTQGTLIVDLVDAQSGKLVWRGSVAGDVDNVKNLHKQIAKGVKAILKKYPGRPEPIG